ncbi:hypothetical protein ABZ439_19585 [Streptomyces sp. NPDC005840]
MTTVRGGMQDDGAPPDAARTAQLTDARRLAAGGWRLAAGG